MHALETAPVEAGPTEDQLLAEELRITESLRNRESPPSAFSPTDEQIFIEESRIAEIEPAAEPDQESTSATEDANIAAETPAPVEPSNVVQSQSSTTSPGSIEFARDARAAADAAEQAARDAVERAVQAETRMEQFGSGRHLEQELLQLQAEANSTSIAYQQAEQAAQEAERLASVEVETPSQETVDEAASMQQVQAPVEEEIQPPLVEGIPDVAETVETAQPSQTAGSMEAFAIAETPDITETAQTEGQEGEETLPYMPESIEQIEDEEEVIEAITAMTIARVTAAAAAEAEALAEASSVRTREARRLARQADQTLLDVHIAIRSGAIRGEEADIALQNAERAVTRAQAILADAEAAEEQALRAAMNAEAEAEVAEGMAFAATNGSEPVLDDSAEAMSTIEDIEIEMELSDEPTVKMHTIHPEEQP